MSVADQFKTFRDAYVIAQSSMDSISTRYKRITKQLNTDFWNNSSETSHSLYIGSYGRDTAAKNVSDIDIYFQLPSADYDKYNGYQSNGQSSLLQAVRASMQKTYSTTSLKGDGQVVVVGFADGITFEVLPGFENKEGSVTFADSNAGGSWKACNPRTEITTFLKRNSEANGNLKSVCRMARIWKANCNVLISGMLIDTLAYNFIDSWTHKDKSYLYHDFLVRDFMRFLSERDQAQDWWRAPGSNSWVHRSGVFEKKAAAALTNAEDAIRHETAGQKWSSKVAWQSIFGTTFTYE